MSIEIAEYKWSIAAGVISVALTLLVTEWAAIKQFAAGMIDASKGPCVGKVLITSPEDGDTVTDEYIPIRGTVEYSGSCRVLFLIVKPVKGARGMFVCDRVSISGKQWKMHARLDSVYDEGRAVIHARLCKSETDYDWPGCLRPRELCRGTASNSITVRLIRE